CTVPLNPTLFDCPHGCVFTLLGTPCDNPTTASLSHPSALGLCYRVASPTARFIRTNILKMATNFEEVAKQFIEFYYNQFDADRKSLASLYREQSMLTFESTSVLGANAIVEKLSSLPFEKVKHHVSTLDAQPSMVGDGIVILVTGQLLVDEEQRPMNYTQAFQLAREPSGQYFVFNDLFKLVYG
ncbi:Nuclear transport factor 2, partial [Tolypocladium capitatum]